MKVAVINANGEHVFSFETSDAPYRFTLETTYGEKVYELRFGHPRVEGVKDKNIVTGVQLQGAPKQ